MGRIADQAQGVAFAGQIVVDAAQHQLAAPAFGLGRQLVAGQPARADDAVVQWRIRAGGAEGLAAKHTRW